MHAQFSSWSDEGEWRYKQSERWGQFKLRNPPNVVLPPESSTRRPWTPRPRRSCGTQRLIQWPEVHWSEHDPSIDSVTCYSPPTLSVCSRNKFCASECIESLLTLHGSGAGFNLSPLAV